MAINYPIAKVMKTGDGKYAVFKCDFETGKANILAYQKWFNTKETAEMWKEKFVNKMLKK